MVEGPDHDAVYPAIEVVGDIRDALTHPEPDPLPQVQGVAAQLVQSGFEGDSRPQALLLEDKGNVAPGQRLFRMAAFCSELAFQLGGGGEDALVFRETQVGRTQEVAALQRCAHCSHPLPPPRVSCTVCRDEADMLAALPRGYSAARVAAISIGIA